MNKNNKKEVNYVVEHNLDIDLSEEDKKEIFSRKLIKVICTLEEMASCDVQ